MSNLREQDAARIRRCVLFALCDIMRGLDDSATKELSRLTYADLRDVRTVLCDLRALVRRAMREKGSKGPPTLG